MYKEPLVSIVMPAYNAEQYIAESIDSVRAQTYSNWELLIIDDESGDGTKQIIDHYRQHDARIIYLYQKNGKQAKARNLGISESKGELVAFLDSDDLWLPTKLKISVDEFNKGEQDILFTNAYYFYTKDDLSDVNKLDDAHVNNVSFCGEDGLRILFRRNWIPMLTTLCTKDVLLAVNGFRSKEGAEDYQLWLNLLAAGYTIRGINAKLSCYRFHNQSVSSKDRRGLNMILYMFKAFFEEHPHLRGHYNKQIIHWIRLHLRQAKTKKDVHQYLNLALLSDLSLRIHCLKALYKIDHLLGFKFFKELVYCLLSLQN